MHKEIRRKDRAITREEALVVLEKAEYGFLGTVDAEGQPYVVPLSFIVRDGRIYVHCGSAGHYQENLAANPKVCFSVVGPTEPVYLNGAFSTYYESCVVFGNAEKVTDETEWRTALLEMARKYLPDYMENADASIDKMKKVTRVYAISMDHVTGKAKRK